MLLTLLSVVEGLYLSTIVGPVANGGTGTSSLGMSQIVTYSTDTRTSTISYGYLKNASDTYPCMISTVPTEAPLDDLELDLSLYTACSAIIKGQASKAIARTSPIGGQYELVGYSSQPDFVNGTLINLCLDERRGSFYLLTHRPPNSTLWIVGGRLDLGRISDTLMDGWRIQSISCFNGNLYGLGSYGLLPTGILTWGPYPRIPGPPSLLPGFGTAGTSPPRTYFFSDPKTLWLVGASMLQQYALDATGGWIPRSSLVLNTTYGVPSAMVAEPSPGSFYGTTPLGLVGYSVRASSGAPTLSGLSATLLLTPRQGTVFRGLRSLVVPTATTSTSATGTASVSSTSQATPTATSAPTGTATPTASWFTSTSTTVSPSTTPPITLTPSGTPTPTSTNSSASSEPIPAGNNVIQTLTVSEKVGLGFGITALLAILGGCVGLYMCWKSGKLWTFWLKGNRVERSNYTYARSNSVRRTLQPIQVVQMSKNPAHIQKLNETRVAMRIAEEQQKTIVEATGQTTTIIRRTFAPVQIPVGNFRVVRATTPGSSV